MSDMGETMRSFKRNAARLAVAAAVQGARRRGHPRWHTSNLREFGKTSSIMRAEGLRIRLINQAF